MESDKIAIRELEILDADKFIQLFDRMLDEDLQELHPFNSQIKETYSHSVLRNYITYSKAKIFGAFYEKELIGFIWGNTPYAGLGFISWLMVKKEFRKQGIGKSLVKYYEDYIKKISGHVVELYCFDRLLDFYKKNGYDVIGIRKKGYYKLKQNILNKYF